ncbi:CrcB family protein [Klenkia sp. PcliD-1-E]|uniref:fluoride efflux transporter FluC n=1 Tax=Klenkia sp. PcliD-1-E TaxID=2954492 RepID=UPI0020978A06|nr:CrcB family protein [Klenkia sp. PcliD-1-E]MCO7219120.1 CrcB family protein [Klenkia sp. PcliD-1-E]
MTALWVALGALVGAPLRLAADRAAVRWRGAGSVVGVLVVNVVGSLVLGVVAGARGLGPVVVALVGTGFCGALTTFSTFGFDVVRLVEERRVARALAYLGGSLLLGLATAAIGYGAVR